MNNLQETSTLKSDKKISISLGIKISILLFGFIIGAGYQMWNSGKSYSENVNRIKEETRNNKELITTLKNGDSDVNIWKKMVSLEDLNNREKELNTTLSGTLNIVNKVNEFKETKIKEAQNLEIKNNQLIKSVNEKGELLENLQNQIELNKSKISGRDWILNMDQYKKKMLFYLDYNKQLRTKYYDKILKLNQFYTINEKNNDSTRLLTNLCDNLLLDYNKNEVICVSSEEGMKNKLSYFSSLIFY